MVHFALHLGFLGFAVALEVDAAFCCFGVAVFAFFVGDVEVGDVKFLFFLFTADFFCTFDSSQSDSSEEVNTSGFDGRSFFFFIFFFGTPSESFFNDCITCFRLASSGRDVFKFALGEGAGRFELSRLTCNTPEPDGLDGALAEVRLDLVKVTMVAEL